jgi:hypothetical protein
MPLINHLSEIDANNAAECPVTALSERVEVCVGTTLEYLAELHAYVERIPNAAGREEASALESIGTQLEQMCDRIKGIDLGPESLPADSALASVLGDFGIEGLRG